MNIQGGHSAIYENKGGPSLAAFGNVSDKAGLLTQILSFNHYPAYYIHDSWIEILTKETKIQGWLDIRYCGESFSRFILEKLDLTDSHDYDFSASEKRLALLPPQDLEKLVLYCGIAARHQVIGSVISRPAQHNIRSLISDQGYSFAVKSAPYLFPQGVKFGTDLKLESDCSNILEILYYPGSLCLGLILGHCSAAFTKRLLLKLPSDCKAGFDSAKMFEEQGHERKLAKIIVQKLLREVFPQWNLL
ncbi:MAG: SctK family type III secretion system sorting platform protein [Oligoflexales bacterium]|nr:SctK family type III secretion system sorting platform protein [Oligoflexales bacterium]